MPDSDHCKVIPSWISSVTVCSHASPAVDVTLLAECEHPLLSILSNASSLHLLYHVYGIWGAMHDKILVFYGLPNESTVGSLIKD